VRCARAVQKEIVEAYPSANLSVLLVWIPMIPTDSEQAARREAGLLSDPRVHHFFDAGKTTGKSYAWDVFGDCIAKALTVLPHDHELRPHLEKWRKGPARKRVVWDAFFSYPAGVEWTDDIPPPSFWTKQVGFFPETQPGEPTGTFWANDCAAMPFDSDWFKEVRTIAAVVMAKYHSGQIPSSPSPNLIPTPGGKDSG
jgi:hypothetical protein